MLGNHDIQLSRNFREKKCYFCELEKKKHNMHGFLN